MQIKALPDQFYRRLPIDDSTPKEAIQRWEKLRLYQRLRRQGCSQKLALEAIGCSRATYYRWKKRFDTSGLPGLVARSRRPRRVRSHTGPPPMSAWCSNCAGAIPISGNCACRSCCSASMA